MLFLGLLPLIFFVLLTFILSTFQSDNGVKRDLRIILLVACILSGCWVVVGTELLSLFRAINFLPVLAWWVISVALLAIALAKRFKRLRGEMWRLAPLHVSDVALLLPTIALVVTSGISAWCSAPNNADSMTYHLPRQVYWIQNHSLTHYPAHVILQNVMEPFSEFVGMHLMLLSGGDRWANLVQWFSLVMILSVVSLIACDLGAGRKGQLLAALLTVSIPPVYIFASNTKNDLVLALWVCILAWWTIRVYMDREPEMIRMALVGLTLGLALLTKGTSSVYVAVPCLVIGAGIVRSRRRIALSAAILFACTIFMTAGHWTRNYRSELFHSWEPGVIQQAFTPAASISNAIRNMTLHMGVPSQEYNALLTEFAERAHTWIGADPQDPRTTYKNSSYEIRYEPHHEDMTPAGAHLMLICLMLVLLLPLSRWIEHRRRFFLYLSVPVGGVFLFCFLLKWAPWHTRLHIPLLCSFMPPLAVMMAETPLRRGLPVALTGVVVALYPTFTDNYRPLFGEHSVFLTDRVTQIFHARPNIKDGAVASADLVAELRPGTVGLQFRAREWEYPLQRLIMDRLPDAPTFSSFDARQMGNWSGMGESPEIVISMAHHEMTLRDTYSGMEFHMVSHFDPYSVFARQDLAVSIGFRGPLPAFVGWDVVDGLRPPVGPFPQWELPVVRWGLGPATNLRFYSYGAPLVLHMVCGPQHLPRQRMKIVLNGEAIGRYRFDRPIEFTDVRITIEPNVGENRLMLEYAAQDESDAEVPRALLFKSLQIVPLECFSPLEEQGRRID
jgi:hypothetical protein